MLHVAPTSDEIFSLDRHQKGLLSRNGVRKVARAARADLLAITNRGDHGEDTKGREHYEWKLRRDISKVLGAADR